MVLCGASLTACPSFAAFGACVCVCMCVCVCVCVCVPTERCCDWHLLHRHHRVRPRRSSHAELEKRMYVSLVVTCTLQAAFADQRSRCCGNFSTC